MTDWSNPEYRIALLKLWVAHTLKRTRKVQPLAKHLLDLGWVTQSSRRGEVELNELGLSRLPAFMDHIWPAWQQTLQQLQDEALPLAVESLVKVARKSRPLPHLPRRLHHKTYAAIEGMHSKNLPAGKAPPRDLALTTDGVLRIRANQGLILRVGETRLSCDDLMTVFGEVILPERALLDGITPCGILPKAVMTVENLGPFVDMPKPGDLLIIHQPGWNTPLSQQFIRTLGPDLPWYHFGDLDPEGIAIYQHLNRGGREVGLFLPSFWNEYEAGFSQPLSGPWPEETVETFPEPLLRKLFATSTWLEQEAIILDRRLESELAMLAAGRR